MLIRPTHVQNPEVNHEKTFYSRCRSCRGAGLPWRRLRFGLIRTRERTEHMSVGTIEVTRTATRITPGSYPGNVNPYTGKEATGDPNRYLERSNNQRNPGTAMARLTTLIRFTGAKGRLCRHTPQGCSPCATAITMTTRSSMIGSSKLF